MKISKSQSEESESEESQESESEALGYLNQVMAFTEERGIDYGEFTSLLREAAYTHKMDTDIPTFIKRVENFFGDRQDLVPGINTFLHDVYQINLEDLPVLKKNSILQSALSLVNKVRFRFRDNEFAYKAFLNAVIENQYENSEVVSILAGHQDLLDEFRRIASYPGSIPEAKETDSEDIMERFYQKGLDLFERAKANIAGDDSDEYMKLLKQVHGYNGKRIARSDVVQSFAKDPQLKAELEELLQQCEDIGAGVVVPKRPKIEEKRCTPSYKHMPINYYRSDLSAQVLNDEWVSKSLFEEKDFKNRPITPREELLYKCEDDRHELDVYLNRLKSTMAKMKELSKLVMSGNNIEIDVQDELSILHFKCIQKLYGEWSRGVIKTLVSNPAVVVPVILASLTEKVKECEDHQTSFNQEVWAPIQAGN